MFTFSHKVSTAISVTKLSKINGISENTWSLHMELLLSDQKTLMLLLMLQLKTNTTWRFKNFLCHSQEIRKKKISFTFIDSNLDFQRYHYLGLPMLSSFEKTNY